MPLSFLRPFTAALVSLSAATHGLGCRSPTPPPSQDAAYVDAAPRANEKSPPVNAGAPAACTRAEAAIEPLRALGHGKVEKAEAELHRPRGPEIQEGDDEVPAIGGCERPNPALRAAIKAAVERWAASPARLAARQLAQRPEPCARRQVIDDLRFACMESDHVLADASWTDRCEGQSDAGAEEQGSAIVRWDGKRLLPVLEERTGAGEWAYQGSVALVMSSGRAGSVRHDVVFEKRVGEGGALRAQWTIGVFGAPWKPDTFGSSPFEMHKIPPGNRYAGDARELVFWLQRPLTITLVAENNEPAGAWKLTGRGFVPLSRVEREAIDRARERLQAQYDAAYLVERLGVSDWKESPAGAGSPDEALKRLGIAADTRAALRRDVMECLATGASSGGL